jgi:hypothetical protein
MHGVRRLAHEAGDRAYWLPRLCRREANEAAAARQARRHSPQRRQCGHRAVLQFARGSLDASILTTTLIARIFGYHFALFDDFWFIDVPSKCAFGNDFYFVFLGFAFSRFILWCGTHIFCFGGSVFVELYLSKLKCRTRREIAQAVLWESPALSGNQPAPRSSTEEAV